MDFARFVDTATARTPSGAASRRDYESIVNQPPCDINNVVVTPSNNVVVAPTSRIPLNPKPTIPFQTSVLFRSATDGDLATLRLLQAPRRAADINAVDAFGWTALMMAACAGHRSVVAYLLRKPHIDATVRDRSQQRTAVSLATQGRHERVAAMIRDHIAAQEDRRQNATTSAVITISDSDVSEDETSQHEPEDSSSSSSFFCADCARSFSHSGGTTRRQHEASILHRFNIRDKLLPLAKRYALPDSNRGFRLMLKQGWDRDRGLGPICRPTTGPTSASGDSDDGAPATTTTTPPPPPMTLGPSFPLKTTLRLGRSGLGVPQPPSRITHFAAHDRSAIVDRRRAPPPPRSLRVSTKRQLRAAEAMRHREERRLRRALD